MKNPIRVMLVDDHDVIRFGLRSFLDTQEHIEVVGEAGNGEEAIERAQEKLKSVDHSMDAEEVAYLQSVISKSTAALRFKRRSH